MKELSIFNQLRPMSVGFENIFSNWERMFEDHFDNSSRYPFYNIKKVKNDNSKVSKVFVFFFSKFLFKNKVKETK